MIHPTRAQTTAAVAAHYDELDVFYREIWGEHVHHGFWATGRESRLAAVEALVDLMATRLDLAPGPAALRHRLRLWRYGGAFGGAPRRPYHRCDRL
jgi:hypothetical protein